MTWFFAALFSLFTLDAPSSGVTAQTSDASCYVDNETGDPDTEKPSVIINVCDDGSGL